jgi:hypothetical protein
MSESFRVAQKILAEVNKNLQQTKSTDRLSLEASPWRNGREQGILIVAQCLDKDYALCLAFSQDRYGTGVQVCKYSDYDYSTGHPQDKNNWGSQGLASVDHAAAFICIELLTYMA